MPLTIGQTLENRYRIDALLGQGGMGAVYQATDLRFNATVAIKENQLVTAESQKQFAREAGLLYRLRHPNLPRVIDHFSIPYQGQYLVMDYIQGEDLKHVIARHGPVPQSQALEWIDRVLAALEYLHAENIIHRDVKPANVKITPGGDVFLVDFGLAKVYDPGQQTTLGARGVTPGYAPPEQYGHGRTDARSDIYSAAASLYALLTGHTPPDALQTMTRQAQLLPPRQLNPRIAPHVEAAILRAMEPAPDDRFQTVSDLRAALVEPPPQQMGVEAAGVRARQAPARPAEAGAAPAATASPAQPVAKAPRRRPEPSRKARQADGSADPAPVEAAAQARSINRKRVTLFALLGAFLGAIGPAGLFGGALLILGLVAYHARHVLRHHGRQYQVEVLGLWLCAVPGYALHLLITGWDADEALGSLFGIPIALWAPSAMFGAVVLWVARRVALRKRR